MKPQNPQEKRKAIRHPRIKPVEFIAGGRLFLGEISNQSHGGAFIRIKEKFQLGQQIELIEPSDVGITQKRKGEIVRVTPQGIGIAFHRPGYF
ncbi:MAG: PilZ domain-containing protein [Thermodesulfobacteriota bacterium]